MEEILELFHSVGITITIAQIKSIFESAENVKIKNNQLSLADF